MIHPRPESPNHRETSAPAVAGVAHTTPSPPLPAGAPAAAAAHAQVSSHSVEPKGAKVHAGKYVELLDGGASEALAKSSASEWTRPVFAIRFLTDREGTTNCLRISRSSLVRTFARSISFRFRHRR